MSSNLNLPAVHVPPSGPFKLTQAEYDAYIAERGCMPCVFYEITDGAGMGVWLGSDDPLLDDIFIASRTARLPPGYQSLASGVNGASIYNISSVGHEMDPMLWDAYGITDASVATGTGAWYKGLQELTVASTPTAPNGEAFACRTFATDEGSNLASIGQTIQIETLVSIGYLVENAAAGVEPPDFYQIGAAVTANGILVSRNSDLYGLNTSGQNSNITDIQAGNFVTDGNDLEVCVYLIVRNDSGAAALPDTTINIDMVQVGIRTTPIS